MDLKGRKVKASIIIKAYIIKGLKANILIGSNILVLENFVIRPGEEKVYISKCEDITAKVKVMSPPPLKTNIKTLKP